MRSRIRPKWDTANDLGAGGIPEPLASPNDQPANDLRRAARMGDGKWRSTDLYLSRQMV